MKKNIITAKIRSDGTVVEVLESGEERPFPDIPMRPMTEEEIEAAAAADPDARPMSPEELRAARRVPRVKTLRRALDLTQQEFSERYHIPLGTLRDWEQGRTEPDQPARAYLTVIARDPEGVRRVLEANAHALGEKRRIIPPTREKSHVEPNRGICRSARGLESAKVKKFKAGALLRAFSRKVPLNSSGISGKCAECRQRLIRRFMTTSRDCATSGVIRSGSNPFAKRVRKQVKEKRHINKPM